jgi:hypothetical protein
VADAIEKLRELLVDPVDIGNQAINLENDEEAEYDTAYFMPGNRNKVAE